MENSIHRISSDEKCKIIHNAKANKYLVVEMDGNMIDTYFDYACIINHEFDLQMSNVVNKDAYLDWMRDLTWIDKDGFVLIINNFKEFLKDNVEERNLIIHDFQDIILPFWEKDIIRCVQGGRAKSFNVFLVT